MQRNSHCGWCGTAFTQTEVYPRVCINDDCRRETYNNPTPVVINVQPVWDKLGNRFGLAIAQRALPPHVGGWTLIGGHIENNGENVRLAGAREFSEETGLDLGNNARIIDDYANGVGHLLLIVESEPIAYDYFVTGTPCHENLALDVLWEMRDLAFPIHTEVALKWFKRQRPR